MRSESEIQNRIRFLLTEALDLRLKELTQRIPSKCACNYNHPLDTRKQVAGEPNEKYNRISGSDQTIGLCLRGVVNHLDWEGRICEEPIDAQRCSFFQPRQSESDARKEFNEQIRDLEWVRIHLPEVYGLLWSLGSSKTPSLPWWKRLWFRLIQIRPDHIAAGQSQLHSPSDN